jgi:hypothetical protein
MLSLYRIFGGVGLVLLGASLLPYPLPSALKWITGACLLVAGVALFLGW